MMSSPHSLPEGFAYLQDPRMHYSMDYATTDNFVGEVIDGYEGQTCIISTPAAEALIQLQNQLDQEHPGLALYIFDTYRPLRAVEHFRRWSSLPEKTHLKERYHPSLSPKEVFDEGYIAFRSEHTRGSALDLTLMNKNSGELLDMGSIIDFFGDVSHTHHPHISDAAKKNRALLLSLMESHGFVNYDKEWWHYRLKDEPFPETYFDFPIR